MTRYRNFYTSSEGGELAPEYALRTDTTIRNKALLKARNIRLLSGGGWQRRWGTAFKATHSKESRYEAIGVGDSQTVLFAFSEYRLDIYDSSWALIQSITVGCPWNEDNIHTMQVAAEANRVTIASKDFTPRELIKTGSTWAIGVKTFTTGQGGSIKQPYYRFQVAGVTLTPSALTGSIGLVMSAAHFVSGHVGTIFRYQGQEITITSVTDSTNAVGTVVNPLYPTLILPVESTSGFQVADVVQGETSKVQGVVVEVTDSTHLKVTLIDGYEYFDGTTPEKLVGPNQRTKLTGVCVDTSPAPTTDWDEQLISTVRGFPNLAAYHRGRLILADFPNAQHLICASVPSDPNNFDVGEGGAADAVIETVGRDDTLRVKFIGSFEQLIVFTEAGTYYVPETVGAPFAPTNAEFLKIGPEAIGDTPPIVVSEGVLFAEARSGRILICIPTGNVRRSWEMADLSELSYHLMETPKKICILPATQTSDREVVVLKSNGEIVWMRYRRGQDSAGWVLWSTNGDWQSMTVVDGRLFLSSKRSIDGDDVYWGEELSPDMVIDGGKLATNGTWAHLPSTEVVLTKDKQFLWEGELSAIGHTDIDSSWGSVAAGLSYDILVEYPSPIDGENGQFRPLTIYKAALFVDQSASFRINGYELGSYHSEAAEDELPALWSGKRESWVRGWDEHPTLKIIQDYPNPLTVLSITLEVKA